MDFPELLTFAKAKAGGERRLSRLTTAGETRIVKLVASGAGEEGACTPCGRCRALIDAINDENYKCEVLLENGSATTIEKLLPYRM